MNEEKEKSHKFVKYDENGIPYILLNGNRAAPVYNPDWIDNLLKLYEQDTQKEKET